MESETRILALWHPQHPDGELDLIQTAIPWCTTHNKSSTYAKSCAVATDDGPVCVISTGGPDHKWWMDVRE